MSNSFDYPLLLVFVLFLLPLPSLSETDGTVAVCESITASDKATPWLSPSADFAFGFRQLQDKKQFLLSIWYNKIPDTAVVWYANNGVPVLQGSKVEVSSEKGGLVLSDPQGKELWKSEIAQGGEVTNAFLHDTGNFVLVSKDSGSLWESFKNPTDTLLPTPVMDLGGVLISRHTETNFSQGYQVRFNTSGHMYILTRDNQRKDLTPPQGMAYPPGEYYHRATIDFDGVFRQYVRLKENAGGWTSIWTEPDNICNSISGYSGGGACWHNGICRLSDDGNRRPECRCPPGFSLLDPSDKHGGCRPNVTSSCEEDNNPSSSAPDMYDLVELPNVDWPGMSYAGVKTPDEDEEVCKQSCLSDCLCAVIIMRGQYCEKKTPPLSNGREPSDKPSKAFLKIRKSEIPAKNSPPSVPESKSQRSVRLGSSLAVNLVLFGTTLLGLFLIYRKKIIRSREGDLTREIKLPCYTYKQLVDATCSFEEELGRGSFGIVYKGVTRVGSTTTVVAVKKLGRVAHGREKEFKSEVDVIGQTHHRNLVRLLGYCDEGEHRMLVYEFMSNCTVASYLFGDMKPDWYQRTKIAVGVARGLCYLHEECSSQIIHCDIKPQNILLDDHYNARISDFGMAKHLMIDHSKTSIASIRRTKGYVAPEWFNNKPITVKERRLNDLVEKDMEALNDWKRMESFVMVAIWCIQEDPSVRPSMWEVANMLEGAVEVPVPPCPSPSFAASK